MWQELRIREVSRHETGSSILFAHSKTALIILIDGPSHFCRWLEGIPQRFVTFHRRVLDDEALEPFDDLASNETPLGAVEFHQDGCIEDATHALQADFANKYIGQLPSRR